MEKLLTKDNGTAEEFLAAAQTAAERAEEKARRALELRRALETAPRHGQNARIVREIKAEAAASCAADARQASKEAATCAAWAEETAHAMGAPEGAPTEEEALRRMDAQNAAWDAHAASRRAGWYAWRAQDWAEQCDRLARLW